MFLLSHLLTRGGWKGATLRSAHPTGGELPPERGPVPAAPRAPRALSTEPGQEGREQPPPQSFFGGFRAEDPELSCDQNRLEGLLKPQAVGPPQDVRFSRSGQGLRLCISGTFPVMLTLLMVDPENPCPVGSSSLRAPEDVSSTSK